MWSLRKHQPLTACKQIGKSLSQEICIYQTYRQLTSGPRSHLASFWLSLHFSSSPLPYYRLKGVAKKMWNGFVCFVLSFPCSMLCCMRGWHHWPTMVEALGSMHAVKAVPPAMHSAEPVPSSVACSFSLLGGTPWHRSLLFTLRRVLTAGIASTLSCFNPFQTS